ncbi:hypothetical protein ARSEF4850_005478 [Beauveria asiatica]
MDEHNKFLADRILSEERPITYRILSRALDVNVNTAKEMLFDFYKYQNALRADSVHATYLVYGVKDALPQPDVDVEMGSSQPEPLTEAVPIMTMTLVTHDKLQETLRQYSKVTAIHIYSLAPNPQKDLILLADVAKSISEYATTEDTAASSKKYGTIYNPHTRRRDRKKGVSAQTSVPAAASKKPEPAAKAVAQPATAPAPAKKEQAPIAIKRETSSSSSAKSTPAPKTSGGGGIMQSFAKAASKPPKAKPVVKKDEDTAMALSDDGEADDDVPAPRKTAAETESLRQAKRKREEDLRRMMEEDDEEEEEEEKEPEDAEMEEPEAEPEPEPEPVKEEKKKPEEVVSTSSDGRRRGKRRVMKKKRMLDDQGYMVTIQEAAWESFSEDDTPALPKKGTPSSTPASSGAKTKKAPAAKGSQGNIMSFFAKK